MASQNEKAARVLSDVETSRYVFTVIILIIYIYKIDEDFDKTKTKIIRPIIVQL